MRPSFLHQVIYDDVFTSDENYYRHTVNFSPSEPLKEDITTDVVIVGGGLSGLATAHFLTQYGLNVVILERHYVGWGASGRNGGQILPGFTSSLQPMIKRYGFDATKLLWDHSVSGVQHIVDLIKKNNIDCDLRRGSVSTFLNGHYDKESTDRYHDVHDKIGHKIDRLNANQTKDILGCAEGVYAGGFHDADNAYHFHPLKYLYGLKQALSGKASIYEHTQVVGVTNETDHVTVYTPAAKITANKVVMCGDSYLGRLVPKLRRKYVLIRNAIIGTGIIPENAGVITKDVCTYEHSGPMFFYKKTADNRLLFGGGDAIMPNKNMLNTEEEIRKTLRQEMITLFPQLEGIDIPYIWGGYIGMTSSYLPYTGVMKDRIHYMGGYSGHGVNQTHAIGHLMAEIIAGKMQHKETTYALIKNISFPGQGNFDVRLARLGMILESLKEKFY